MFMFAGLSMYGMSMVDEQVGDARRVQTLYTITGNLLHITSNAIYILHVIMHIMLQDLLSLYLMYGLSCACAYLWE
jgi:hypothetical protein